MAQRAGKHTIVLVQYTPSYQTRSYMDFPSVGAAMDAIVKMYEHKLKELNPFAPNITYELNDLFNFIDTIYDITSLVFDPNTNQYAPKDKDWVKSKIMVHLRSQAA